MSVINRLVDRILFWGGFAGGAYVAYQKMPAALKQLAATLRNNPNAQQLLADSGLTGKLTKRFAGATTAGAAIAYARTLQAQSVGVTLALLDDDAKAIEAKQAYQALIEEFSAAMIDTTVAIKPSHLGIHQSAAIAYDNLIAILKVAHATKVAVTLETEELATIQATIELHNRARTAGYDLAIMLQARLRRTSHDLENLIYKGAHVWLTEGDYKEGNYQQVVAEDEIRPKLATFTERLLSPHAITHKARLTLNTSNNQLLQTAFNRLRSAQLPKDHIEIGLRYGERPELLPHLIDEGYRVRVYLPIGTNANTYILNRIVADPTLLLS